MAISRRRRQRPSREELRALLARPSTLGDLIDFADTLGAGEIEPALRLLCSLLPTDGAAENEAMRAWALCGALITRYLFSVVGVPRDREWPL